MYHIENDNPGLVHPSFGFAIKKQDETCIKILSRFESDLPTHCFLRALDRDRVPIDLAQESAIPSFEFLVHDLRWTKYSGSSGCEVTKRLESALGNSIVAKASVYTSKFPPPRESRYIEIELAHSLSPSATPKRNSESYYVERRRCDLGFGLDFKKPCYGFFVNDALVKERIGQVERILNDTPKPLPDAVRSETLVKALFSLLGGYDTPLLWKE